MKGLHLRCCEAFFRCVSVKLSLYFTSWKVNNPAKLWPQQFQLCGVTLSTTAVKILEMYLQGVYFNLFEKSAPSNIFSDRFNQICRAQIRKTCLGGCFWRVLSHFNWSKFFCFLYSTKLQWNTYLVKFSSTIDIVLT